MSCDRQNHIKLEKIQVLDLQAKTSTTSVIQACHVHNRKINHENLENIFWKIKSKILLIILHSRGTVGGQHMRLNSNVKSTWFYQKPCEAELCCVNFSLDQK